jgi:Ras GTPase-activating-like protein IQGAP2/3/Ras GTPase-activating-like protein IQGAP1
MWKGGLYFTGFLYIITNKTVNRWMESVLKEELPPTTQLEENLQNGVFLAKLGNIIAPETVPLAKIYDIDQKLFRVAGLQFRHTDNINYWLKSLEAASLPTVSAELLLSL